MPSTPAIISEQPSVDSEFRGVSEDVQLFKVFWRHVAELIKVCVTHS
jgi:hypothetical protein